MQRYGKEIRAASSVKIKLYPFIRQLHNNYEDDTDDEQPANNGENAATLSYNLEDNSESCKSKSQDIVWWQVHRTVAWLLYNYVVKNWKRAATVL